MPPMPFEEVLKAANVLWPFRWRLWVGSLIGLASNCVLGIPGWSKAIVANEWFHPVLLANSFVLFWCASLFFISLYATIEEKKGFIKWVAPSTDFQKMFGLLFAGILFVCPIIMFILTPFFGTEIRGGK